jgi:hypothetical protein
MKMCTYILIDAVPKFHVDTNKEVTFEDVQVDSGTCGGKTFEEAAKQAFEKVGFTLDGAQFVGRSFTSTYEVFLILQNGNAYLCSITDVSNEKVGLEATPNRILM